MKEDTKYIAKCIELAKQGLAQGQAPFSSIVTKDGEVIAESANGSRDKISDHAEILVLDKAHKFLKSPDLSGCILYTICEPCPMCSFMMREYRISKVVYALKSPFMGGHSRWPILQDDEITQFKDYFAPAPKVVEGIMEDEAKKVFDQTPLWMFGTNPQKK